MSQCHPQPSCRSRVTQFLAGFILLFFAGDWAIAKLRLPHLIGSTNIARRKWEMLRDQGVAPNVVILGSSFEEFGVNPTVLSEAAAEQFGREVTSMNLAAPASSLNTQYLVVRKLLEGSARPELVYMGITPYAADSGRERWIRNGLTALADHRDLCDCWPMDWSMFCETLTASMFRSYFQWNDLRLIVRNVVLATPWGDDLATAPSALGWREQSGKLRAQRTTPRGAGTERTSERYFAPAPWRFDSNNINGRRVRDAIAALRLNGVTVRLLELPHASISLIESDPRKNLYYRAFVDALVAETGVALVCPPEGLLVDEDYVDAGHLLPSGAAKLSRWLASDVTKALTARGARLAAANELRPPNRSGRRNPTD